jgi:hypothetical protein
VYWSFDAFSVGGGGEEVVKLVCNKRVLANTSKEA